MMLIPLVIAVCLGLAWFMIYKETSRGFADSLAKRVGKSNSSNTKISVLLVFAHPDDEAMFFTPTLHTLMTPSSSSQNASFELHFLCITQGNYDKLGATREAEMHKSANFYKAASCVVVHDERALDGPSAEWDMAYVARDVIAKRIAEVKADVVLTFDDYGVSGHKNHRDVFAAVKLAADEIRRSSAFVNSKPVCYKLLSLPLYKKYLSIYGVAMRHYFMEKTPATILSSNGCGPAKSVLKIVLAPTQGWLAMRGLWIHRSQFVWFRFFFVVLAAYTYENVLVEF